MSFALLSSVRVDALRAADFSYDAVGATAFEPPSGFDYFSSSRVLESRDFEAAAEVVMSWGMHQRAGLRVAASSPTVEPESGEERFVVQRRTDGSIEATISAFSRPATPAARLGGPVTVWMQRAMTRRYLSALEKS